MNYHVTCNTDDNYAQHCCAMLCSLFENNGDLLFHVHILTHGLSDNNKDQINKLCSRYNCQLSVYEVDEAKLDGVQFRKNRPLTKAAYYRILLPEVLGDDIDRILYLDCDMIVIGDVKELYDLELDEYALAATLDCMPYNSVHRQQLQMEADERSFCSGIMMINLKYWRENNAMGKLLEFSKRKRKPVFLHDQDSLNYVFKKKWLLLPPKWNKSALSYMPVVDGTLYFDIYEYVYEPKVIHFSSDAKPWFKISFPYSNLYKKYLYKSGYSTPSFQQITWNKRIQFKIMNIRYYTRKYIVPLIPSIIVVLLSDILKVLRILFSMTNKQRIRSFLLNEGIKAIKNQ